MNNSFCINCGEHLSSSQIKEGNKFCSHSCSASYNNKLRRGYKQETRVCPQCNNKFIVERSDPQKFCCQSCASKFNAKIAKKPIKELTNGQKFILENFPFIRMFRERDFSYAIIANALNINAETLEYNYKKFCRLANLEY